MMNRKGLSDVVTTVLIVLLTIVAISILWSFLQPMFTKSGTKIQQAEACLAVNFEVPSCLVDGTVTVRRGAGEGNVGEVKLIFERADGSTQIVTSTNVPEQLGTSVYSNTLDAAPTKVSVAAGIADSKGTINYCNPTQPVACR